MSLTNEAPALPTSIWVEVWTDELTDRLGHDPRSHYVEVFWLGVLGPSTTWLIRRLATELEASPGGFELRTDEMAREIGLGSKGGRNSVFGRSIERACQFGVARREGDHQLYARRMIPPLSDRSVERLPERLRRIHSDWTAAADHQPTRARRLALTLFELGDPFDEVERQLHIWGIHPAAAYQGTLWAHGRHSEALTAVESER
jgi:hypothetical protein